MPLYRGKNFCPFANYTVTATTTSQNLAVTQPTSLGDIARDILIQNSGTSVVFITYGTTTQTATNAGLAVLPGAIMIIDCGIAVTNIGVIAASGTPVVYISIGTGT